MNTHFRLRPEGDRGTHKAGCPDQTGCLFGRARFARSRSGHICFGAAHMSHRDVHGQQSLLSSSLLLAAKNLLPPGGKKMPCIFCLFFSFFYSAHDTDTRAHVAERCPIVLLAWMPVSPTMTWSTPHCICQHLSSMLAATLAQGGTMSTQYVGTNNCQKSRNFSIPSR